MEGVNSQLKESSAEQTIKTMLLSSLVCPVQMFCFIAIVAIVSFEQINHGH